MVNSVYYIGIYEIEDRFMLEFKSSPHGVSGMRGYRSFLGMIVGEYVRLFV
jgi:hypothetical protein